MPFHAREVEAAFGEVERAPAQGEHPVGTRGVGLAGLDLGRAAVWSPPGLAAYPLGELERGLNPCFPR